MEALEKDDGSSGDLSKGWEGFFLKPGRYGGISKAKNSWQYLMFIIMLLVPIVQDCVHQYHLGDVNCSRVLSFTVIVWGDDPI